jgi:hypothetical protein
MDVFYRTRMGQQFFLTTMPKLTEELERLNANLERIAAALEAHQKPAERVPNSQDVS